MPCRACRHAILGDEVVAHIRQHVEATPPPDAALIEALRPIFTNPAFPGGGAAYLVLLGPSAGQRRSATFRHVWQG